MILPMNPTHASLQRVAQWSVLQQTLALARNTKAPPEVRAAAIGGLGALLTHLRGGMASPDTTTRGHIALASREIRTVLEGK